MNADQFQELYKLLRGSKAANAVLDARALFMEKKLQTAYQKLSEARESFAESRSRVLKQTPQQQLDPKARDADRQLKKLKRKQDKTMETIKTFDELLPQLKKLVDRQQRHEELEQARELDSQPPHEQLTPEATPEATPEDSPESSLESTLEQETVERIARSSDVSEELIAALSDAPIEQRLNIINQHFGFREVQSNEDLHGDALYYVQTASAAILACTPSADQMRTEIRLISVIDQRPIKPFSRDAFLRLGTSRKMVLLTIREGDEEPVEEGSGETEPAEVEQKLLDLGAFSQLLTSAQRCGLVSDADQIGFVRDREFRMRKYDLAFQSIDAMFARFMASAGQHTQRLAREDADISAGRTKISPKDLQAKRARDRRQTQEIDRAKRRFQVVLEGLRVLKNTDP